VLLGTLFDRLNFQFANSKNVCNQTVLKSPFRSEMPDRSYIALFTLVGAFRVKCQVLQVCL